MVRHLFSLAQQYLFAAHVVDPHSQLSGFLSPHIVSEHDDNPFVSAMKAELKNKKETISKKNNFLIIPL
jgi:hypothetical protein